MYYNISKKTRHETRDHSRKRDRRPQTRDSKDETQDARSETHLIGGPRPRTLKVDPEIFSVFSEAW